MFGDYRTNTERDMDVIDLVPVTQLAPETDLEKETYEEAVQAAWENQRDQVDMLLASVDAPGPVLPDGGKSEPF